MNRRKQIQISQSMKSAKQFTRKKPDKKSKEA